MKIIKCICLAYLFATPALALTPEQIAQQQLVIQQQQEQALQNERNRNWFKGGNANIDSNSYEKAASQGAKDRMIQEGIFDLKNYGNENTNTMDNGQWLSNYGNSDTIQNGDFQLVGDIALNNAGYGTGNASLEDILWTIGDGLNYGGGLILRGKDENGNYKTLLGGEFSLTEAGLVLGTDLAFIVVPVPGAGTATKVATKASVSAGKQIVKEVAKKSAENVVKTTTKKIIEESVENAAVKISEHAIKRAAERGISKESMVNAIKNGEKYFDKANNSVVHVVKEGEKYIMVATDKATGLIKTTIKSSNPKKIIRPRYEKIN